VAFGDDPKGYRQPGRLTMDPGEGNLQEQLLRAAIVGPFRVAHGVKKTRNLQPNEPLVLAEVATPARSCVYVAVFLPFSRPGPVKMTVGCEMQQGSSAGIPVLLETKVGEAGVSFSCVLQPGESLVAQSEIEAVVIVSMVAF